MTHHHHSQQHDGHGQAHAAPEARGGDTAIDPVCGMRVDPTAAAHAAEHGGRRYFFGSDSCLVKFRADPGKYVSHASHHAAPAMSLSSVSVMGNALRLRRLSL